MVSKVNDAFYKGGQFMPETGLFCGAMKKAKKHAQTAGNWSELTVKAGYKGYWVEATVVGMKYKLVLEKKPFESLDEAVAYAEAALRHRADFNRSKRLQPHPTLLTILDKKCEAEL